ncbi:MAG: hypothetical protein U0736_17835 [Gemmataceae bacterium]
MYRAVASVVGWLFAALTPMIGLAVLAALPVLQFLSLGYLLEAGGRVGAVGPAARRLHRRAPGGAPGRHRGG